MSINLIVEDDMILMIKQHKFDAFGHGANCQNVMGAGIAAQIKLHFPEMFTADKLGHKQAGLGGFTKAPINVKHLHSNKQVLGYNLYTQFQLGPHATIDAISKSLLGCLLDLDKVNAKTTLAIPMIGCGIGGLSHEEVLKAFKETYHQYIFSERNHISISCNVSLYIIMRKADVVKLSTEEKKSILHEWGYKHFIDYEGHNVQI